MAITPKAQIPWAKIVEIQERKGQETGAAQPLEEVDAKARPIEWKAVPEQKGRTRQVASKRQDLLEKNRPRKGGAGQKAL